MTQHSYPDVAAGQRVTPTLLSGGLPVVALKTSSESSTSSTTFTDDAELVFPLEANATYIADLWIIAHQTTGDSTAIDINTEWSVPSGSTGGKWCLGPAVAMTNRDSTSMVSAFHGFTTDRRYGLDQSDQTVCIHEHLLIKTTTAGDLQFRFAQDNANASATVITDDSHLIVQRVA